MQIVLIVSAIIVSITTFLLACVRVEKIVCDVQLQRSGCMRFVCYHSAEFGSAWVCHPQHRDCRDGERR